MYNTCFIILANQQYNLRPCFYGKNHIYVTQSIQQMIIYNRRLCFGIVLPNQL